MIPKNKKGMNQVEYISAMIIFLFGVVIIMYFALTFNLIQHKDYLTAVENNLRKETEITYSKYYLSNSAVGICFNISHEDIPENITNNQDKLTILNSDGVEVRYEWQNENLGVSGNTGNYILIISPNSSSLLSSTCTLPSESQKFSFEEKFNAISFDKLKEFQENYSLNYENLKELIAENKNFNIEIENTGVCENTEGDSFDGMTVSRYIPRNVEVTAGEFPAKLFIKPNLICDVKVTIKLWD